MHGEQKPSPALIQNTRSVYELPVQRWQTKRVVDPAKF
jgi:hypothetical protein